MNENRKEALCDGTLQEEKTMRKTINHVFLWIIIYNAVTLLVATIASKFTQDQGIQLIAATVIGTGFVFLCTSRRWKVNPFVRSRKKMTVRDFFTVLGIFSISQIISLCVSLITDAIGMEGTSISMGDMTVALIIYASFSGPFIEEVIYRGFAIGTMKRKGLIPAIVLSSLAFGLMHGNFSQFVIGTLSGLLLGFVFSEYSIWWCFLIHLINNSIGTAIMLVPQAQQNIVGYIAYGVYGLLALFGIIEVIRRRDEVREWFARPENHMQKGDLKGILSSAWMWIFALIYLGVIITIMIFPNLADVLVQAK